MKFTTPSNHRSKIIKVYLLIIVGYAALYPVSKYISEIKSTVFDSGDYLTFYTVGGCILFTFLLFYGYCLSIEINSDQKFLKLVKTNIFNKHSVLKIDFSELEYRIMENYSWKKIVFFRNGKQVGVFWSNDISKAAYESTKGTLKALKKERKY